MSLFLPAVVLNCSLKAPMVLEVEFKANIFFLVIVSSISSI